MHFGNKEYPYQAIKMNYFNSNYDDLLIRRDKTRYFNFWNDQKGIKDFIVQKNYRDEPNEENGKKSKKQKKYSATILYTPNKNKKYQRYSSNKSLKRLTRYNYEISNKKIPRRGKRGSRAKTISLRS